MCKEEINVMYVFVPNEHDLPLTKVKNITCIYKLKGQKLADK